MVIINKIKSPRLSKTQNFLKPVENAFLKEYYLMRGNGGIVSKKIRALKKPKNLFRRKTK